MDVGAGSGEELPGSLGGTTADADRRNAIVREKILGLAAIHANAFRKFGFELSVAKKWDEFTAAVDELVASR